MLPTWQFCIQNLQTGQTQCLLLCIFKFTSCFLHCRACICVHHWSFIIRVKHFKKCRNKMVPVQIYNLGNFDYFCWHNNNNYVLSQFRLGFLYSPFVWRGPKDNDPSQDLLWDQERFPFYFGERFILAQPNQSQIEVNLFITVYFSYELAVVVLFWCGSKPTNSGSSSFH